MRLNSATVSRHHARLQVDSGGRVWIQDLGSTSGTFLAGDRIQKAEIQAGAILRIADVELRVRVEAQEEGPEESGMDMQLEGEWEEGVAPPAEVPAAPDLQPKTPSAPAPSKAQPSAKDLRRAQQVGDLGGPSQAAKGRNRVLQYSQHNTSYGLGGGEFNQRAPWQKALAVLVALAIFAGLAYGAFQLTQGARGTRADTLDVGAQSAPESSSGKF